MKHKLCLLAVFSIFILIEGGGHGEDHIEGSEGIGGKKANYKFEYGVDNPETNDYKSQYEYRDGDYVVGAYEVKEADGTKRIVKYRSGPGTGFEAVVEKVGTAVHPTTVIGDAVQGGYSGGIGGHGFGGYGGPGGFGGLGYFGMGGFGDVKGGLGTGYSGFKIGDFGGYSGGMGGFGGIRGRSFVGPTHWGNQGHGGYVGHGGFGGFGMFGGHGGFLHKL